jgi:signal transduction histidine kinase
VNGAFDRLREAIESQVRFTADASHELRTPLAVLRASTEWARRAPRTEEELRETLASCERAALRIERVVEDLLQLARADAQLESPELDVVDLSTLARDIVSQLQPLAGRHGVVLDCDGEPASVVGSTERLRTLVTCLTTNAVEHGGSHAEVRTGLEGDQARLCVRDNGPGIPPGDIERIFERFQRVDPARSRKSGGGGLGLAIARQIALAHGGTLTASNRPGGGACFLLCLPRAQGTEPGRTDAVTPSAGA